MNHINHGIEVYSRNIQPEVEVRGSFDKPQARGLLELQTSDDLNLRLYIPGIHPKMPHFLFAYIL